MSHRTSESPRHSIIPLHSVDAAPVRACRRDAEAEATLDTPAALMVNDHPIAQRHIAAEMQHFPGDQFESSWHQAARALIIRELLLQQARRLALDTTPQADVQGGIETEEDALIRALIEREVPPCEAPPEQVRRHYDDHPERFMTPLLQETEHILIAARRDQADAFAAARAKADQLHARLLQAPERFAELARRFSDCASGAEGGRLGQLGPGETTPPFEAALQRLAPGDISTPVETAYGFHLIRLLRRGEPRRLPFEAVSSVIADRLTEQAHRRAIARYIAQLIAQADIQGFTPEPSPPPIS